MITRAEFHDRCETLYGQYNRRTLIHPDPLECVYRFETRADREVAGLISAALAYGRVAHILANLSKIFEPMAGNPAEYLENTPEKELMSTYGDFRHRWTTSAELVRLLAGIGRVRNQYGSLENCFLAYHQPDENTSIHGLAGLITELGGPSSLLSDPLKTSACKRLHLFMRWMARSDNVDPGCWTSVSAAHLIIPLDTHMFRIARSLRLTRKKQPNLPAAVDITRAFRKMKPDDPLKYDFVLTRFGIRADMCMDEFLASCRAQRPRAAAAEG